MQEVQNRVEGNIRTVRAQIRSFLNSALKVLNKAIFPQNTKKEKSSVLIYILSEERKLSTICMHSMKLCGIEAQAELSAIKAWKSWNNKRRVTKLFWKNAHISP